MKKIVLLFGMLYFPILLFGVPVSFDQELYAHLKRQSAINFNNAVKKAGGDLGNYNGWKKTVDQVFSKLSKAAGRPDPLFYAIIKNENFNAYAFPGGHFVIHSSALDYFDSIIAKNHKSAKPQEKNRLREEYFAFIIGHELAHFYNRHTFHYSKTLLSLADDKKPMDVLTGLKHNRDAENDADLTSFFYLNKAGYNTNYALSTLELFNQLRQEDLKNEKKFTRGLLSVYLSTHPSGHERLSHFDKKNQEFHKWATLMEKVFADIQHGVQLEPALSEVRKAIEKYPNSIDFRKAEAVCLHKLWIQSTSYEELKFRPIIDQPSFRDNMLSNSKSKRAKGVGKVPGSAELYYKALKAYRELSQKTEDMYFFSNYSSLLVYSPKPEDINEALKLAMKVQEYQPTLQSSNNLALVLYIAGKEEEGYKVFKSLSENIDKYFFESIRNGEKEYSEKEKLQFLENTNKKLQNIDRNFVSDDFTPLLNFALAEFYRKSKTASNLAGYYFSFYESDSGWAKYLSSITGQTIPKPPASHVSQYTVNGFRFGDTIKTVIEKWGKADVVHQNVYEEIWDYNSLGIRVRIQDLSIRSLEFLSSTGVRLNGTIGVGDGYDQVLQTFGKNFKRKGDYFVFEGPVNAALTFQMGMVTGIYLYVNQ